MHGALFESVWLWVWSHQRTQGSTFRVVRSGSRIGHGCGHTKGHKEALFEWSGSRIGHGCGYIKGTRKHFSSGQASMGLVSHHIRSGKKRSMHLDIFIFLIFTFIIEAASSTAYIRSGCRQQSK